MAITPDSARSSRMGLTHSDRSPPASGCNPQRRRKPLPASLFVSPLSLRRPQPLVPMFRSLRGGLFSRCDPVGDRARDCAIPHWQDGSNGRPIPPIALLLDGWPEFQQGASRRLEPSQKLVRGFSGFCSTDPVDLDKPVLHRFRSWSLEAYGASCW